MFIRISFSMNQDWAFCRVVLILDFSSEGVVALTMNVESSAYDNNLHKDSSKLFARSFVKQMKSNGPKIDPWGTPVVTGFSVEV